MLLGLLLLFLAPVLINRPFNLYSLGLAATFPSVVLFFRRISLNPPYIFRTIAVFLSSSPNLSASAAIFLELDVLLGSEVLLSNQIDYIFQIDVKS